MKMMIKGLLPDTRCTLIADRDCVNCVLNYSVEKGKFVHADLVGENTFIHISTEFEEELSKFLASKGIICKRKRSVLFGYRNRLGILFGALVFVLLILNFSSILWKMDFSGNERLTDQDMIALLRECGVYEGMRIKDINNDLVRIKMMAMSKDIAWISVNVKGMRAQVIVSEAEMRPVKDVDAKYSHIVAAFDGIITGIVVERGQQMVRVGEAVKKGDLLVSGIIEERDGDINLVNASARVYAQTERVISVARPLVSEKVAIRQGSLQGILFEIFGKSINFSLNYGLGAQECDIIRKRGSIYIFGSFQLPVSYVALYGTEKLVSSVELNSAEARLAAEAEAYRILFSQADAELVSKRFAYESSEDMLKVTLYAVCEENISATSPFTAEP